MLYRLMLFLFMQNENEIKNYRSRKYIISWNNYPEELELQELLNNILDLAELKYCILAKEVGEKGTRHVQGYMHFKHPQYFNSTRKVFKNNDGTYGFIQRARGNDLQNFDYCSKDGNYIEYGTIEEEKEDEASLMIEDIISGMSFFDLLKKYSHLIYYHYRDFKSIYFDIKNELTSMEMQKHLKEIERNKENDKKNR